MDVESTSELSTLRCRILDAMRLVLGESEYALYEHYLDKLLAKTAFDADIAAFDKGFDAGYAEGVEDYSK